VYEAFKQFLLFGVLLLILSQPGFGAILDVLAGSDFFVTMPGTSFMGVPLGALNFYYITLAAHGGTSSTGLVYDDQPELERLWHRCEPRGHFLLGFERLFLTSGWAP
jgi:hypothetical protein